MLERDIERKAVKEAEKDGWLSYKFASPAHRGVPDRIFIKRGHVVFIEFKTPTGKTTKLQERELEIINSHGATAAVAHSIDEALGILRTVEMMGWHHLTVRPKERSE